MADFKVGQRVMATNDAGYVRKGMRGVVRGFHRFTSAIGVEWDSLTKGHNGNNDGMICDHGKGWYVIPESLKLIYPASNQSIHITTDGDIVHAILKDDGKIVKRAKAVCAPSDTFDLQTGAKLAFDRLFAVEPEKPKYYSGKVVCVAVSGSYWKGRIEAGRVYDVDNGSFVFSDGLKSIRYYTDIPGKKEVFACAEFIEFKG